MDATKTNSINTTENAWQLNEVGFSIFPLGSPHEEPPKWFIENRCQGDIEKAKQDWPKAPRFSWKQYQQTAATDAQIESWTTQWPNTNWAIVTGCQVVVVDADSQAAVTYIESGELTRTPLRATTSKGKHYYFQSSKEFPVRNFVGTSKIDIRGAGGYVVAPGSTHADGTVYQWETDDYMEIDNFHDLPVLTQEDVAKINSFNGNDVQQEPIGNPGFRASDYAVPHDGSNLAEGEGRNNAAASLAGQLIRHGTSLKEVKNLLDQWNGNNNPPLSDTELNTTIASIARTHLNNNPDLVIATNPIESILPAFEFVNAEELAFNVKPVNWLIKGLFEMDSLAMMFGEPGCGKSFAALDIVCCVASGKDWHSKQVKMPGSVFYIAGEGFNGLSRRIIAWKMVNGYPVKNLSISKCAASLTEAISAKLVSDSIEQQIIASGGIAPSLIVIDTLARNFGAGDENTTKEMNLFISNVDRYFRERFNCCVLIIHHTGVGNKDRARGNSALKGALDAEYSITKNDDELTITPKKMKDAEEPVTMNFTFESVRMPFNDEDGEPQFSCVLQSFDKKAEGLIKKIEAGKKQAEVNIGNKQVQILQTLDQLYVKAKSNLAKANRDPDLARIETKGLREECVKLKLVEGKNWSRTFNAMIERDFLKVDPPFVNLTPKAYKVLSND